MVTMGIFFSMNDPITATLRAHILACLRLTQLLPETDLVNQLSICIQYQADVILQLSEHSSIYLHDLKKVNNHARKIIKQLDLLENKKEKKRKVNKS